MGDDIIVMFEFEQTSRGIGISSERHYRLVPPEDVSEADLETYRHRTQD